MTRILFIFAILSIAILTSCKNKSKSNDPYEWHSSRPYNRYQNNQRRQNEISKRNFEAEQQRLMQERLKNMPKVSTPVIPSTSSSSSSRSHYADLWDEAEELESILEDNNIDHESLSYPIDYHDLEDLRDEYESLLEENNIDY